MKKYLLGLMGLFFVMAASAFVVIENNKTKTTTENPLYWFDPTGTTYDGLRVKGDIETPGTQIYHTDCNGNFLNVECQRGFTIDKLLDEEHPELGVDPLKVNEWSDMIFVSEN